MIDSIFGSNLEESRLLKKRGGLVSNGSIKDVSVSAVLRGIFPRGSDILKDTGRVSSGGGGVLDSMHSSSSYNRRRRRRRGMHGGDRRFDMISSSKKKKYNYDEKNGRWFGVSGGMRNQRGSRVRGGFDRKGDKGFIRDSGSYRSNSVVQQSKKGFRLVVHNGAVKLRAVNNDLKEIGGYVGRVRRFGGVPGVRRNIKILLKDVNFERLSYGDIEYRNDRFGRIIPLRKFGKDKMTLSSERVINAKSFNAAMKAHLDFKFFSKGLRKRAKRRKIKRISFSVLVRRILKRKQSKPHLYDKFAKIFLPKAGRRRYRKFINYKGIYWFMGRYFSRIKFMYGRKSGRRVRILSRYLLGKSLFLIKFFNRAYSRKYYKNSVKCLNSKVLLLFRDRKRRPTIGIRKVFFKSKWGVRRDISKFVLARVGYKGKYRVWLKRRRIILPGNFFFLFPFNVFRKEFKFFDALGSRVVLSISKWFTYFSFYLGADVDPYMDLDAVSLFGVEKSWRRVYSIFWVFSYKWWRFVLGSNSLPSCNKFLHLHRKFLLRPIDFGSVFFKNYHWYFFDLYGLHMVNRLDRALTVDNFLRLRVWALKRFKFLKNFRLRFGKRLLVASSARSQSFNNVLKEFVEDILLKIAKRKDNLVSYLFDIDRFGSIRNVFFKFLGFFSFSLFTNVLYFIFFHHLFLRKRLVGFVRFILVSFYFNLFFLGVFSFYFRSLGFYMYLRSERSRFFFADFVTTFGRLHLYKSLLSFYKISVGFLLAPGTFRRKLFLTYSHEYWVRGLRTSWLYFVGRLSSYFRVFRRQRFKSLADKHMRLMTGARQFRWDGRVWLFNFFNYVTVDRFKFFDRSVFLDDCLGRFPALYSFIRSDSHGQVGRRFGRVYLKVGKHNTYMTLTDSLGGVKLSISCGQLNIQGPQKKTDLAIILLGRSFGKLCYSFGYRHLKLLVAHKMSQRVYSCFRGMFENKLKAYGIFGRYAVYSTSNRLRKHRRK